MKEYQSPYEVLGLPQGASLQDIKDAYRRLCLQHHPDLQTAENLRPAAEQYFKEISGAYTALTRRGSGADASASGAAWSSSQAYSAAAGRAARAGTHRYSNGMVGAVIAAPLVLFGIWLQQKMNAPAYGKFDPRPHGLLQPPINPYLREDLKPRTYSRLWSSNTPRRDGARNGQQAAAPS